MSSKENLGYLIPLEDIKLATNNFDETNVIGAGGLGMVYKGELSDEEGHVITVAIKRLDRSHGQGNQEFLSEIGMLSSIKHENLVSLVGFCDESGERILVYEFQSRGSLDRYLSSTDLTWIERLQICLGAARGLSYLHSGLGEHLRIIHRDVTSSNILLDENWKAKLSDFGISNFGPANQQSSFLVTNITGTPGYVDPLYFATGMLTKESDVYSFGVVLFEVLCGRPAVVQGDENGHEYLALLARQGYKQKELDTIISPVLREQMDSKSLSTFSSVAYQCLNEHPRRRPTMDLIVETLEEVLKLQQTGGNLEEETNEDDYYKEVEDVEEKISEDEYHEEVGYLEEETSQDGEEVEDQEEEINNDVTDEDAGDHEEISQDDNYEVPFMEKVSSLRLSLEMIKLATNNFDASNVIGEGGFGAVYKGELSSKEGHIIRVAIKRLDRRHAQGDREFLTEIQMLASIKHENLVSLVGFCEESGEMILAYEYQSRGSLDRYLSTTDLTWIKRLQICVGAARGLSYLHSGLGEHLRIIHRNVTSSNILLDENWEAKLSDFGLSKLGGPANQMQTFLVTNGMGTHGYVDPSYFATGVLTKESDVYMFGVVLLEVLCGRLAIAYHDDEQRFLPQLAKRYYKEGNMEEIVDSLLMKQMGPDSLSNFSEIVFRCLKMNQKKRPKMDLILRTLEEILEFEMASPVQQVGGGPTEKPKVQDADFESMLQTKKLEHFRIPFEDINRATRNFAEEYRIGGGAFGGVYRAELFHIVVKKDVRQNNIAEVTMGELSGYLRIRSKVAVKRLDRRYGQGKTQFLQEIEILSCFTHKNLVSLLGFCYEEPEMILVYELAVNRSLDWCYRKAGRIFSHNWGQRLQICLDVAQGLNYLHNGVGENYSIHRDIKSPNILLGGNWEGKIGDFGFSIICKGTNREQPISVPDYSGTLGYIDPEYRKTHSVTGVEVFSLAAISSATNSFSESNIMEKGASSKLYKGELSFSNRRRDVAIKRLNPKESSYEEDEFLKKISLLFSYSHNNVIPLLGFCEEDNEKIIVFERAMKGSLDKHIGKSILSWKQWLQICINAAHGLNHIHVGVEHQPAVHGDIKSSNILLNSDWKATICDFIISKSEGTLGYQDPLHIRSTESDVYSFGVVLFEILCGRLAIAEEFEDEQRFLFHWAPHCLKNNKLKEIIHHDIKNIDKDSLDRLSKIANDCLSEDREKRPTMSKVIEELEKAFEFQDEWEWEQRLPKDYEKIIQMSKSPEVYSMKKREIYTRLSSGIFLHKEKVWFSLSTNGANNEMISATEFSYQRVTSLKWRSQRNPRFPKVAKVFNISNLNIQIHISTRFLTSGISYGANLVFRFWDQRKVLSRPVYVNLKYQQAGQTLNAYFAMWRDDKWMMIELCRFLNHSQTTDFEVLIEGFSSHYCRSGAIFIEGIEFRPIGRVDHEERKELGDEKNEQSLLKPDMNLGIGEHLGDDYQEILVRSENHVPNASKENEFLYKGILIDRGEKLFWISRVNKKKCHMLPPKAVIYKSSNVEGKSRYSMVQFRSWKPPFRSRFAEVVELISHQVFRIKCHIETLMLSQDTTYACYLVFRISEKSRGLEGPVKARDLLPYRNKETKIISLRSPSPVNLPKIKWVPQQREDGWMEVIVWEILSGNGYKGDYLPMDLELICFEGNMSGLIVCGIEFRPI